MSEQNTSNETSQEQEQEQTAPVQFTGFVNTIKTEVNKGVTANIVLDRAVSILTTKKIEDRAALLTKVVDVLTKHNSELNKIRAKSTGFDESGNALPKVFSAEDFDKRKKLREKVALIEKAVAAATTATAGDEEWKKLDEVVSKNSQ